MTQKPATFGPWLRRKLLERRISLSKLAREAGCHYTYLWRIIHVDTAGGRRYERPSYLLTRKIGELLDAPLEALAAAGYQSDMDVEAARYLDASARHQADTSELRDREALQDVVPAGRVGMVDLPLLGDIQAGNLREAIAASDESGQLPEWVAHGATFCLRVRGSSMEPTLLDGDWVAVREQGAAQAGQLVVARIDDEFTLKRYNERAGVRMLVADNPSWGPVPCGPRARIVGVVTGLFRPDDVLRRRPS